MKESLIDIIFYSPQAGQIFIGQALIISGVFYGSYKLVKYLMPTIINQIDTNKERIFLIGGVTLSLLLGLSRALISWISLKFQSYFSDGLLMQYGTSIGLVYFSIYIVLLFLFLKHMVSSTDDYTLQCKLKFLGIFFALLIIGAIIGIKILRMVVMY